MSKRPIHFKPEDSFYAFTVHRPVAILMVVMAVVVFGAVSYNRLALTLMPDMSYPTLTVRTTYPGTAPEEMESVIARPLEQQLGIIPKLVSISSISKAGQTDVVLEFQWKTDMDIVAQEVREKIDRLRLPDGAQRPLLLHYDPSLDPILRVGVSGSQSLYDLRHLAEYEIKRRLETLPGVAAIQIRGGLVEEFLVAIDESKLSTLKLDITQIGQRLQQGNVNMPGGNLREGQTEYVIRTMNEFRTMEEIGALIVSRSNAIDIRLRDIATITRYHKDREVITRVNGQESVEVEIFKEADANVVTVAETVRNALFGTAEQQAYVARMKTEPATTATTVGFLRAGGKGRKPSDGSKPSMKLVTSEKPDKPSNKPSDNKKTSKPSPSEAKKAAIAAATAEMEKQRALAQEAVVRRNMTDFLAQQMPAGTAVTLLSDQSVFISGSIEEVESNAVVGGIISVVVIFVFLRNVTQTIVLSLSIPISIMATFAPMYLTGVSLNIISLGGLALGVGMLVDNGIVVLESIFRCQEEGDDLFTAVVRGTQEVGMAVVASTLTTVAVFLPIVFVEGVAGQVFGDMALTVVFSLLASLASALFVIPMLASRRMATSTAGGQTESSSYLQFPVRSAGTSAILHPFQILGAVVGRTLWAVIIIVAALLKVVAVLTLAVLWVALLPIELGLHGRGAYGAAVQRGWAWLSHWAASDVLFGSVRGAQVWPGMLSFTALPRLRGSLIQLFTWLVARRWRWIVLLVIPALCVAALVLFRMRSGAPPPGNYYNYSPGGPFRGLMGGLSTKPMYLSLWYWTLAQPWWFLALAFIPAVTATVFTVVRTGLELLFRLLGTLLQTVVLGLAQAAIGLVQAMGALFGPATGGSLTWFENGYMAVQNGYPRLIAIALRHRALVLGGAALSFVLCWVFVFPRLGKELIPQVQQGEFNLDVTLPIGSPLERTAGVAAQIDEVVLAQPEVDRTALTVGAEEGASTSIEAGEHTARLTVKLKRNLPTNAEAALIDRIRKNFRNLPEVKLEVSYPALFSFRSPVEVEIRGHELATLKRISRQAEALLAEKVPGLVDVRSTLQAGHPEIQVVYNRDRLAEYGLSLRSVAELVRNKVQGRTATEFRKDDQMIDIVVRLREEDRFGIEGLRQLVINPTGAVQLTLSAVADLTINEGPSEIRRVDQQRTAVITANIRGADLATATKDIIAAMNSIEYPAGFSFVISGQNKEMKTSLNSLLLAFALALFLVYIVMASQFESLVQPLLIMVSVPLALIGVAVVLWLAEIPVSIMVFLGLIILAGIVVNNAIVLIDYINTLRARGYELTEAIAEAGRARLRPILMTTLTTVLGLVPMAIGVGEGAEIRAPMAITVIVGLTSSTILTLFVIPTLYFQFPGRRQLVDSGNEETSEAGTRLLPDAQPTPMAK